jgi:hypothetical protein
VLGGAEVVPPDGAVVAAVALVVGGVVDVTWW